MMNKQKKEETGGGNAPRNNTMNETQKTERFWIEHHKLSEPFKPDMCFCPKCKTQWNDPHTMNETKKAVKRIETVADIPDDFQLIQDSQDIHSVLESIGGLNYESETGSLFVKTGEGEFEAVYMTTGFVPFLTARVYQLA